MVDWQQYLASVCKEYRQWWRFYTITDVVGERAAKEQNEAAPLLDLGLRVAVGDKVADDEAFLRGDSQKSDGSTDEGKQPTVESLGVLEGLRKYAVEHLLLVGRPGSGKSTALVRLLLEEAQQGLEAENERATIPVLMELRYFQSSAIGLIQSFVLRHSGVLLPDERTEQLLFEGKFLLLVDGVNELPSEEARLSVKVFRRDHPKTPMIFTTRDISLGGDLAIKRKLEMQRLSDRQMQQFVCQYLPQGQGEQMWRQMGEQLRRLGETPLLLWMLCAVFKEKQGVLPTNLGLVFRAFTKKYDAEVKEDVAVAKKDKSRWPELLKCLAFEMIRGNAPTEVLVSIPEQRAQQILAEYLNEEGVPDARQVANEKLAELLKHHLVQKRADDQIEFRHQLIQEYYAAEKLREQLTGLLANQEIFKREYLNYLKWTEPLKLLLELVSEQDSPQALSLIETALKVDLQLGAKLAGAVVETLQSRTVRLVSSVELSPLPKIHLLNMTKSQEAIPNFIEMLENVSSDVRKSAVEALGKQNSEVATAGLMQALEDEDSSVRKSAVEALGKQNSEAATTGLIQALEHEDSIVRGCSAAALGKQNSEVVAAGLIQALEDEDSGVRRCVAIALGKQNSEVATAGLMQALEDEDSNVRERVVDALGKRNNETATAGLIQALEDEDSRVRRFAVEALGEQNSEAATAGLIQALEHENSNVRARAVEVLGNQNSEAATAGLIHTLEDEDSIVRWSAVEALVKQNSEASTAGLIQVLRGEYGLLWRKEKYGLFSKAAEALGKHNSEAATAGLIQALEHEDDYIRWYAVEALVKQNSEAATVGLIQALEHEDSHVRGYAAQALGDRHSEAATAGLIQALEGEYDDIRWRAAEALGKQNSEAATAGLIQALKHESFRVRWNAVEALGDQNSETATAGLIQTLEDENSRVRWSAVEALGKQQSEAATTSLIQTLEDEDSSMRRCAAEALGKQNSEAATASLIQALEDEDEDVRRYAVEALGKQNSEAATAGLIQALKHEDSNVYWRAAEALGQQNSEAATAGLIQALKHEDFPVRWRAAEALGQQNSEAATAGLIQALEHENFDVRWHAAEALGQQNSEAAIAGLIQALEHEDSNVRWHAAEALRKRSNETITAGLIQALKDEDDDVRKRAAEALGQQNNEAATAGLIQVLEDEDYDVRRSAVEALRKQNSGAATAGLIQALENELFDVRWSAVEALGQQNSEAATAGLILALEDEDFSVREHATEALGQRNSEAVTAGLILALEDEYYDVRMIAAEALGQRNSEAVTASLIQALEDKDSDVRKSAAEALRKQNSEVAITGLIQALEHENSYVRENAAAALGQLDNPRILRCLEQLKTKSIYSDSLQAMAGIQEHCKFYRYELTQPLPSSPIKITPNKKEPDSVPIPTRTLTANILHLSDLHFGTVESANLWANQLAADLTHELSHPPLDALIISGDIANFATPEEYTATQTFLTHIQQDFPLSKDQIIIVPGNHDIDWQVAKKAYRLVDRDDCKEPLIDGNYIPIGDGTEAVRLRDQEEYHQRFANFSNFYQSIKGTSYLLDYAQQFTLDHLPQQNLLILGLNSAWNLDHHFTTRVSINMEALTNALTQIHRNKEKYDNCRKIAVWHHPLDSPYTDRITDQEFLEQLAVNGFRLFLHGHVHKAETNQFRYDMSIAGRKLDRICAGTFGAPTHERSEAIPWQYNLLQFNGDTLTVRTRKRESENGAWTPDTRWLQGPGQPALDYYSIEL
jgi:HEAT repeat protein